MFLGSVSAFLLPFSPFSTLTQNMISQKIILQYAVLDFKMYSYSVTDYKALILFLPAFYIMWSSHTIN